jgi:hypothetical protein
MFDVFVAEKDAFNTVDEKKALEHIYTLTTISVISASWKKRITYDSFFFGWAIWELEQRMKIWKRMITEMPLRRKVLVIDAAKCGSIQ